MKKYLIAFSLLLFTTTTFANITIKGVVSDGLDSAKKLKGVTITLDDKSKLPSKDKGVFTIPNIPTEKYPILSFSFKDYYSLEGAIGCSSDTISKTPCDYVFTPYQAGDNSLKEIPLKLISKDNYELKIDMFPTKDEKPIFAGIVYTADVDGNIEAPAKEVAISISGEHSEYFDINNGTDKTDDKGAFSVTGYKFATEKTYILNFSLAGFKDEKREVTIKKGANNKPEGNLKIVFRETTTAKKLQKNKEDTFGFDCNEMMPKYLVGANCVENSTLEGDATDFAVWIQKFGSKITGMISMIAVALIVWNAFIIVTAAGEEEKISQGKKGIMWTILGLAVTMFAYVVVKTVIMLTYTQ